MRWRLVPRGGGASGHAGASELEPQYPPSRVLIVSWSEFPLSGGRGRQTGEILAWTGTFQSLINDIARTVDSHADRNIDMTVNRISCAARNLRDLFMEHRG